MGGQIWRESGGGNFLGWEAGETAGTLNPYSIRIIV
jgi:hypothetical protein